MHTLAQRLGTFASRVDLDEVPVAVRERASNCLLHAVVVGAAAHATGFDALVTSAVTGGQGGRCSVMGRPDGFPAPLAAFANGVLLHARVQEDTHGTFHPGVTVVPAALAAAQDSGADGRALLAGIIAGYEVGGALSRELTDRATPPHRATGVFGPAAAAAAAARVLGLDPDRTSAAISLAAALSGGSTESFGAGTHEWHFQSGQAAMSGVLAARLARQGAAASMTAFEAPGGYLECYAGGGAGHERIGASLGSTWEILEVTFKPYPVCAFNQAPAIASIALAQELGARLDSVTAVEIRMNPREATYPGVANQGPITTPEEALMSAPMCVATGLATGNVTFDALRRGNDPTIADLLSRCTVVPDPSRKPKSVQLSVSLTDGRVLGSVIDNTDELLSWSTEQVHVNATRLLPETRWDDAQLKAVIDEIEMLQHTADVAEFIAVALQ